MKTIRKKDIRLQFENALQRLVADLKIKPSKKVILLVKNASKKIGAQVKADLKKQEAQEAKLLKRELKASKKASKKTKDSTKTVIAG